MDCEVLHALNTTTPGLTHATIAFAQMSSLTVFVVNLDMFNHCPFMLSFANWHSFQFLFRSP
jgi:hypothetical protein